MQLTDLGFGVPDGATFESFFEYDEISGTINPMAYFPEKPAYIDDHLLEDILNGQFPVPCLSSSVALVAAVLSSDIILTISGKKDPVYAPEFRFVDLCNATFSTHTQNWTNE